MRPIWHPMTAARNGVVGLMLPLARVAMGVHGTELVLRHAELQGLDGFLDEQGTEYIRSIVTGVVDD